MSTSERFHELVKDPLLSGAHVRRKATAGAIGPPGEANLRSLYWRIYLNILSPSPTVWPDALARLRRQWVDLHDYLRAPDGKWVEGAGPTSGVITNATSPSASPFDPLGNEQGNPWPAWYEDLELRRVIRQDVERTFPDNPYFRLPHVKNTLTNILFCFAKLHVDVSYRQGMHEILAIILWCTDMDSLEGSSDSSNKSSLAYLVLSRAHVEHDTYVIFNVLMTNMLSWYDPTQSVPAYLGSYNGYQNVSNAPLVQPVVAKCARIHDLLKKVDFELWKRMEELKIEPQIYGIRWLRLLFSREFPIAYSLQLWDAMLADDIHPLLHTVDYICLAMLLRIRESLLDADYSTFLHGLLRYPTPADGSPRVLLLVQQASYLCDNPTNFGGAYVRRQNQQSGAEAGVKTGSRAEEAMYERRAATPLTPGTPNRQPGTPSTALLDQGRSIAEGLYGRAEALGINKAVFTALGDLRKSVQAYQAQQPASTLSEIPSKAPWQSEYPQNTVAELKRLRAENNTLGKTLAASLEILKAESTRVSGGTSAPSQATQASLEAIGRVRDVLLGQTTPSSRTTDRPGSGQLLALPISSKVSPSREPMSATGPIPSLMDDTSPSMATAEFAPEYKSSFIYPTAPPRSTTARPSVSQMHPTPPVSDTATQPRAPAPVHSHRRTISNSADLDDTFPDFNDWARTLPVAQQSAAKLVGSSGMPDAPRSAHVADVSRFPLAGNGDHPDYSYVTDNRYRNPPRRPQQASDPLGVLF